MMNQQANPNNHQVAPKEQQQQGQNGMAVNGEYFNGMVTGKEPYNPFSHTNVMGAPMGQQQLQQQQQYIYEQQQQQYQNQQFQQARNQFQNF